MHATTRHVLQARRTVRLDAALGVICALVAMVSAGAANAQDSSGVRIAQVAAGDEHTCAVTTAGAALCWGRNFYGQLGNNSTTISHVPVSVSGLGSGVAAIAAGGKHTCAVTATGAVKCWGYNHYGQLGNNSTTDSHVPMGVSGLGSGVAAIAAGERHTCALTTTGAVKCWGDNHNGQLGDNSTTDSHVPVAVSGLGSGVAAIAASGSHTCALTTTGAVKCWGDNGVGQLGNNSTTDSPVPVDVSGLGSGVAAIAAGGAHTCALTTTGAVKCWGWNEHGQLGNNNTTDSHVPVAVSGLGSGVVDIAAGAAHTCALTTTGAVKCWGWNSSGQLGNNSTTDSYVPVAVSGLGSGVAAIAPGNFHTCALTMNGAVQCWGDNYVGQLGNNSTTDSHVPVAVVGLSGVGDRVFCGNFEGSPCASHIVIFGFLDISVTEDYDGTYINWVTGCIENSSVGIFTCPSGTDFNAYKETNGQLAYSFAADSIDSVAACVSTNGHTCDDLAPGSSVGPLSPFSNGDPSSAVVAGGYHYLGFKFFNEQTGEVNYGFVVVSSTPPSGFPYEILGYEYDNSGAPITILQ